MNRKANDPASSSSKNAVTQIENNLAILERLNRSLEIVDEIPDIKEIRDRAEVVRQYTKSARVGFDLQNKAAEVKFRAERLAGRMLTEMPLHGGDRKSSSHRDHLILTDLGIDYSQSKRWQRQNAPNSLRSVRPRPPARLPRRRRT